jgi:hypothetical protein
MAAAVAETLVNTKTSVPSQSSASVAQSQNAQADSKASESKGSNLVITKLTPEYIWIGDVSYPLRIKDSNGEWRSPGALVRKGEDEALRARWCGIVNAYGVLAIESAEVVGTECHVRENPKVTMPTIEDWRP